MLARAEPLEYLVERRRLVHANHVESRRHDLVHRRVGEGEDAEQHVAFRVAEGRRGGARRPDQGVQSAVNAREQPEQRRERGQRPAPQGKRERGELGREPGDAARQRVPQHEEQQHGDADRPERGCPGPLPPAHGVGRGHRPQHEEGEPGHVERAMQRNAGTGGDRRRISQGVRRLSDGRLFPQCQESRPHRGQHRDERRSPDERHQRAFGLRRRRT